MGGVVDGAGVGKRVEFNGFEERGGWVYSWDAGVEVGAEAEVRVSAGRVGAVGAFDVRPGAERVESAEEEWSAEEELRVNGYIGSGF